MAYIWVNGHKRDAIRRPVLAGLEPADRIVLEPGALKDWNVLLITLDTTRADHLNCYGYASTGTPSLNSLARQGVLYSEAFTPVPTTLAAHSSLLTGLYPFNHGVRHNRGFKLEDRNVTMAEVLRQSGYRTGAVVSSFVLDSQFGIAQGFDTFNDDLTVGVTPFESAPRERTAEQTNVPAIEWLREHGREKFFFWVHYFDPHDPYTPPEPYRSRHAKVLYDGEIEFVDEQIGKLLGFLDEMDVRGRTLIVLAGDHGEGLGQHGEETHGIFVYDPMMHVPMIFSAPAPFPQGQVVHDQVSLVDVMPTVLELLGLPARDASDGISLLEKVGDIRASVYIETIHTTIQYGWAPLIGIRRRDHKLILAPESELYDLYRDPGEEKNLHESKPEIAGELFTELVDSIGKDDPYMVTVFKRNLAVDEGTSRKLASLGYIGGGAATDEPPRFLPDPKDMIAQLRNCRRAHEFQESGRMKEAIEILEGVLKVDPGNATVRDDLLNCYIVVGQYDKANDVVDTGLQFSPDNPDLLRGKAQIMLFGGKPEKAREFYRQMQEIHPEDTEALLGLAKVAHMQGRTDEAITNLEEAARINPGTAGPIAYTLIGVIRLQTGQPREARQAFRAALKIEPRNADAYAGLANVLIHEGRRDEAMKYLRLSLKFDPTALHAMQRLAAWHAEKGDLPRAAALCRRALAINPGHVETLSTMALVCRQQGEFDEAIRKYSEILAREPDNVRALMGRADGLWRLGRHAEYIADHERALKILPDNPGILNDLAWVLATSPEDELRDGRRAIKLAEKACRADDYKRAAFIGTLAAAYAEAGDFSKAVQWAAQALNIADENQKPELARNLSSYKAGKPWRE